MTSKQEILDEINKTKEHLANMEKKLKECEYERWKPKENEKFFYIDENGTIYDSDFDSDYIFDSNRVAFYNCFQTREQAEAEAEKILVRRQLEDIARCLNKGKKIDWDDEKQTKSFLFFDSATQLIERDCNIRNKIQGVVYCLDTDFRKIAIQEIGEERLKKYLRGE